MLPVFLSVAVHILSSTGSPLNSVLTSPSIVFLLPNWLTCVHPCMPVILVVPLDSPTLIFCPLLSSAPHLVAIVLTLQPLKVGTLSLHLSILVPVLIPSIVTLRPTIASRLSNPLNSFLLVLRIWLLLTAVHLY